MSVGLSPPKLPPETMKPPRNRDFFIVLIYAIVSAIAFLLAAVNEEKLAGDLEWAYFYSALFVFSVVGALILSSSRAVTGIVVFGTLSPLAAPGVFFLVSMIFCLFVSSGRAVLGLGMAALVKACLSRK